MDCTNSKTLGDKYVTEIESCDFTVDNGGLYDPIDNLAELHWLASFLDEPLIEKAPKPLLPPCFIAETKDIHAEEQSSDELRSSISVSKLERSSCSGKMASLSPEMTAPGKARRDMARVPIRTPSLTNLNMVRENCADSFISANAAVASDSDHLVSVQTKSHPSNRVSKTYQGTETKLEDVTMVLKCINCGTQKVPQLIAGPMGPETLCNGCSVRCRSARHLHNFVSELEKSHASNKIFKTNQGVKNKGQDAVQIKKCMHCGIQRTPQWRAGPMGPKTLCNACGVRCRSGKLLPKYRPAASPNFSVNKLSNSHKVVLERRGQREFATQQASEAKEKYSGSKVQYVVSSQEELENSPNSSIFANAPVCSGLDYFVSKQPRSDSLKRILKTNQGIIKKGQDAMKARKCMHCSIKKTPQWRDGPMGPKTLCNACGVRYRSGRLLPEYRPAASPTFSVDKHSNSHKKVMEMRGQKEFAL
ncbi:hypothetical protein KI387_032288 [Taxus chinensis]|uniref:GATA-type domain-containing protein n=1 Tax=Taxus chinensis TaxID=29808 RepID=A0AA38BPT9_TAXCH|nr:hypothetical protein KI387_032288 [Taxus chinensis]